MLTTATSVPGRQRLAALVDQALAKLRGLRGLTEEELLEFGRLYRRAVAQLSHARADGADCRRPRATELAGGPRLRDALRHRIHRLLRAAPLLRGRAAPDLPAPPAALPGLQPLLFLVPALLAAALTLLRPDLLEMLSPELSASLRDLAERHAGGRTGCRPTTRPIMSSMIMTNNIQVSFMAFAGGMLWRWGRCWC